MDCANLISIIISMAAFVFPVYVFFKHDKRIKILEKEKLERENKESKQANLAVKYYWLFDKCILRIQNIGKSTAKNIIVCIVSEKTPLTFRNGNTQCHISQLEVMEKTDPIPLNGEYLNEIKVTLTWDDESGKGITTTKIAEEENGHEFIGK